MSPPEVLHVIDGNEVSSVSGATFPTTNPASGQPLGDVSLGGQEDVDRAVASAWGAHEDGRWRHLRPAERAARLRSFARLIDDHRDDIARLDVDDIGKPISDARRDANAAIELVDFAGTLPEHVRGTVYADAPGSFPHARREPYGVVGAIAPWNFPIVNAALKSVYALAAGNSVVLKMAEQSPRSASRFALLGLEAGIPAGVLNVVHGDGETGAALAAHPRVPKITFTGSSAVGREILRAAANRVASVHLELGGKSPNLVFADADLDAALEGSLFTATFNSGQVCSSATRLIVDKHVADDLVSELAARMRGLRIGDPHDAATDLGPLVSADQLERVERYVAAAQSDGGEVVTGGDRPQVDGLDRGYFYAPTVLTGLDPMARTAQEEIFGPVVTVLPFTDEGEAIRLANGVEYGLAATVWTSRLDRAQRLMDRLEAGIIWVGCAHRGPAHVPYEGWKSSGLGVDKGVEAIETFTRLKVCHVAYDPRCAGV